jgi:leucyl-tRNA synthetase
MYLMFMGPFTDGGDWNDRGITGIARFVEKVYNFFSATTLEEDTTMSGLMHKTVKKVTEAINDLRFNVAISGLMEAMNELGSNKKITREDASVFAKLMAPLAPHFAEEIWREVLGNTDSIFNTSWPTFDEAQTIDDEVEIVVQINGKIRGKTKIALDAPKDDVLALVKSIDNVAEYLEDATIIKEIYVPNKLVSFVVK